MDGAQTKQLAWEAATFLQGLLEKEVAAQHAVALTGQYIQARVISERAAGLDPDNDAPWKQS